ncbi:MAG TPA: 3-oxoacyl-[acyl-carrier-protein] synthase III C-terminal domain-containing protein [Polyangiaceae bacterium]|nr:3-oxoacyl-[acyl-carrier-protein] synthase III C-terminal domain-containing protein [Polyangiaceae bacterium]
MDTNDEWIVQRTGISQRHFAPDGVGASDLALPAARLALEAAGKQVSDVDYILFNTMTPDHIFPGSGALLGAKLGCPGVPALDLRAQCAAMVFSFQVADGLLKSGAARCILLIGAEAHAGFMPWVDWDILEKDTGRKPAPADYERATRHRGLAIIFGDGAGALVLESGAPLGAGVLAVDIHSDGRYTDELCLRPGFRRRPYLSQADVGSEDLIPHMNGREVFKHAVNNLPQSARAVCAKAGVALSDVDWFVAHQANDRINGLVQARLEVPAEKVPSNIAKYGNTSAATIPILLDEMRRDGRLKPGQLVCFLALGAGLHWGSVLVRV